MVYTPELLRERGGQISLKMPFTHPASNGYVMTVDKPEQFYQIRKGKKSDLLDQLRMSQWSSAENTAPAYEAAGVALGLNKMDYDRLLQVGVLSAARGSFIE